MTSLTFGSLFAGIGGFDLGLERAGMICKWQVEIDEFCQKVLTKHWPNVPKYRDIRECGDNLEPVDLICGGFPCQPFSVAGKRRGKKDDRYLWPEMLRVIEAIRPAWVVGENVPGIIGMGLDTVLSDLETVSYTTRTFVIPACGAGAPHRRYRVWVVAYNESNLRGTPRNERPETSDRSSRTMADTKNSHGWGTDDSDNPGRRDSQTGGCRISERWIQHWSTEPNVGRVANGVPSRVDRLKSLGNAIVPQVAGFIGRRIVEFDKK